MAKKIPMSVEGRAREARKRRKIADAIKIGVATMCVAAVAAWGYLLLAG